MKSLLTWVRTNLAIVLLSLVVVVVLPAGWIGSSLWTSRIVRTQASEASQAYRELNQQSVSYRLPSLTPDETPIELTREPNPKLTEWFAEELEARQREAELVVQRAVEFNRDKHEVLVEGLFPQPADERQRPIKALELAEALVGTADRPSAYQRLLDAIRAGGPVDPQRLLDALQDLRLREVEKFRAQFGHTDLTPEVQAQISELLVKHRIGEYQRRAQEVSVYATLDQIPLAKPGAGGRPATVPSPPPTTAECFAWQFDYWVIESLLQAIASANTIDGELAPVPESVVKRIISIELDELPIFGNEALVTASPRAPRSQPGIVPIRPTVSVTGRVGSTDNQLYDVRVATMTLIVASSRIPELFDALARTNFMTVLDADITEVDPYEHLAQGYYYGEDHVVQLRLQIETIWLRSWTVPLMPPPVRNNLGVVAQAEGGSR